MPQTLTLRSYPVSIGTGQALCVMAGLNVLETRDLALRVGETLKETCEQLGLPYVFKASFDKANRSSITSYRGPGLDDGLEILAAVKAAHDVPIITDYHTAQQAEPVAEVADILQVPAFLCRQTDLVVAGAKAIEARGGWLHVKKAQFLAPWDAKNIVSKVGEVTETNPTILCERGASFGYNNLTVDMLAIPAMKALGVPVTIDATHAVQLPGADPRTGGGSTGGRREGVSIIAAAAVVSGADGVFLEFHPEPDKALCDGPSCLPLTAARPLLERCKRLHEIAAEGDIPV
ncbi:MAG: 3-deoxy-8-phosphooctulonate synthase [Pseudomonadota bacterium]